MASSSRRGDITGIVLLLAVVVLAGFILTASSQDGPQIASAEKHPNPSLDNTRASGSRGLYEWTKRLGYAPQVFRAGFSTLPNHGDASVLFCIAPDAVDSSDLDIPTPTGTTSAATKRNTLTADEGKALRNWVASGHTAVLLASSLPYGELNVGPGQADSFVNEIGLKAETSLPMTAKRDTFAPMQPGPWTTGVSSIRIAPGNRLYRKAVGGVTLFGDVVSPPSSGVLAGVGMQTALDPEAVALVYPIGHGHVVAVSDDLFASNTNLCRADNAAFIRNVLNQSARPGDVILFDEFHRSYGGQSRGVWEAMGRPLQLVVYQIALAGLIALLVLIPRLGRPEPLDRAGGRSSAEYVTSLAGLYQSAGATKTALEAVYRQFLRETCRRCGLPVDVTLDELAAAAARRGGVNAAALRELFVSYERALDDKSKLTDREMIVLMREIERYRKEMGIG